MISWIDWQRSDNGPRMELRQLSPEFYCCSFYYIQTKTLFFCLGLSIFWKVYLPSPCKMSQCGFKGYRRDAAQAQEASRGQIFELDQTQYHEGITVVGSSSSTSTFPSALARPPQPLLIQQPPLPGLMAASEPVPKVPQNPPLKPKTQVYITVIYRLGLHWTIFVDFQNTSGIYRCISSSDKFDSQAWGRCLGWTWLFVLDRCQTNSTLSRLLLLWHILSRLLHLCPQEFTNALGRGLGLWTGIFCLPWYRHASRRHCIYKSWSLWISVWQWSCH